MDLIAPIALLCGLTLAFGWLLMSARSRFENDDSSLIDAIDALLPQTQCAQCGYPGCRPYAEAVAAGAAIDLCPPGGKATFEALEALTGRSEGLPPTVPEPATARIRERECIGCFLCIRACPVDAIIGAPGFMHTVIESECTGCELCLLACPVDCIDLVRPTGEPAEGATPSSGRMHASAKDEAPARLLRLTTPDGLATQQPRPQSGGHSEQESDQGVRSGNRQSSAEGRGYKDRSVARERPGPLLASRPAGNHAVQPCIGCNRCEPVCPANLAPRELLWLSTAARLDAAAELGLGRCIECRLCDRVCPSDIPLARIFGDGKLALEESAARDTEAARAKARFEARTARLAAEQAAAQARRAERLARPNIAPGRLSS